MTIRRTITAHCDAEGCTTTLEIDPGHTQVWQFTSSQGWSLDHDTDGDTLTYCPKHGVKS